MHTSSAPSTTVRSYAAHRTIPRNTREVARHTVARSIGAVSRCLSNEFGRCSEANESSRWPANRSDHDRFQHSGLDHFTVGMPEPVAYAQCKSVGSPPCVAALIADVLGRVVNSQGAAVRRRVGSRTASSIRRSGESDDLATRGRCTQPRPSVLVVSPLMPPASGGAAVYYDLLTTYLLMRRPSLSLSIVTERFPGQPTSWKDMGGRRAIHRILPHFSHRGQRDLVGIVAASARQFVVSCLPVLAAVCKYDVVVVHGGFHVHPNFLGASIRVARRIRPRTLFVVDVRDQLAPKKRTRSMVHYHQVIACGESVRRHLLGAGVRDVVLVPVPLDLTALDERRSRAVLKKYSLERCSYLLFTNGVNSTKNVDMAVRVQQAVARAGCVVPLIIVGRNRDSSLVVDHAVAQGHVRVLGPLPQEEVLALSSCAGAVLNLSRSEGVPRSTLEAIGVGAPVLLPADVPEFSNAGPVADLSSVSRCAELVIDVLSGRALVTYDIDAHDIERLVDTYLNLWLGAKPQE